jgi:BirA family biotin operon repressor/biotin-[acetyl-CoA-carboxylase] ligase
MESRYTDLERPPLNVEALRRALLVPGSLWRELDVVQQTGSTNADLRAAARAGTPEGRVLVAEEQVAGRGRLDRSWTAPARSALTVSVLLRPSSPAPTPWGWLPLLAAIAVDDALRRFEVESSGVKWPNDVLIGERKVAGVLSERVEDSTGTSVVIGMGLNVGLRDGELPTPTATSLLIAGETTDREALLRALLRALQDRYREWSTGSVADLRRTYLERSVSVGRTVHVLLPGGEEIGGTAVDVDTSGALVVDDGSRRHLVAAADVTHARIQS